MLHYAPARVVAGTLDPTRTRRGLKTCKGNPDQGQDTRPATLTRNPKLLGIMWDEYQNGVGGQKATREFT